MKKLLCLGLYVFLCACSSQTKLSDSSFETSAPIKKNSRPTRGIASETTSIDEESLLRSLGLERGSEDLGFQEKSFNTCEVGYGYSSSHDCEKQHFVVIHFRLQCRDSEGTVSTILNDADLTPIADRDIKWTIAGRQGVARTDAMGFGQIKAIFSRSQKGQRLKLASQGEFLYIRTGDIQKIVTPKPWCPR